MAEPKHQIISGILWLDLEMTGLDPRKDKIIEIAAIATNPEMDELDEGIEIQIHISDEEVKLMDDVVLKMHTVNGLIEKCKASKENYESAEISLLEYMKKHFEQYEAPLAGNSIWTDKTFLFQHMPKANAYLNHRVIDNTTIKQLLRIYKPALKYTKAKSDHTALSDIKSSIDQMKYYRDLIFKD